MKIKPCFLLLCGILSCSNQSEQSVSDGQTTSADTAVLATKNVPDPSKIVPKESETPVEMPAKSIVKSVSVKQTSKDQGKASKSDKPLAIPASENAKPIENPIVNTSPQAPQVAHSSAPGAQAPKQEQLPDKEKEVTPLITTVTHDAWEKLLSKYVNTEGKVNYKGLKSEQSALNAYLKLLSDNPPKSNWSRNDQMAYWINAYNAFTIQLILDHYPVTSITQLDKGKTWDVKRIKIGDNTYSLNDIENSILRGQFKEARIHFVLNCAARSCPPLLNHAVTGDKLSAYLDQQAKKFINNAQFNQLKPGEIVLSRIFDWYKSDFGNLIDFLNKYAETRIKADAKVRYNEYDWNLNSQ